MKGPMFSFAKNFLLERRKLHKKSDKLGWRHTCKNLHCCQCI